MSEVNLMFETRKMRTKLTAIFCMIAVNIFAVGISDETVIAEFDGGAITMSDLESRLGMIAPIYQPKYSTPEGKENLLNDLCTEELFYLEAQARNVKQDERYFPAIDNQIKSVYFGEYKKDLFDRELTFTSAEKKAYFNEHQAAYFAGRAYEEAEAEIEQRMRPQKERELFEQKKAELYELYQIKFNEEAIARFNLTDSESNLVNREQILVACTIPEIELSVGEFAAKFEHLPEQNKRALHTNDDLKRYLENRTELEVFFHEAVGQGLEENEIVKKSIDQIHRNMMLRTVYNQLVVDPIDMSDKALQKFYKENIASFSTNPYRKIQTFGFESEEVAKEMLKKVKQLLKKKDEAGISALIAENSVYSTKDGILNYIYHNGIIPGIGKDEVYNDMVWKTKPNKLSSIFQNSKGVYVFFRILEDVKAVASPLDSIKTKVQSQMAKDISKKNFEDWTVRLEEKFNLKKYPERLIVKLTAEEYFNKAENAQKRRRFNDAIFYYDEVIKYYKNNDDDYKATFMKGFLYAEELHDKQNALISFKEVLTNFPSGELHESAQFMIDELEGRTNLLEEFEGEVPQD